MSTLKTSCLLLPLMLLLDFLWIGVLMPDFYRAEVGALLRRDGETLAPRLGAAVLVYFLIPLGLMLYVRPRIGPMATPWNAFLHGAVFGAVLYGVYDFTNLAVLEQWTLRVALVDLAWGMTLCGLSAIAIRQGDRWWNR